MKKIGEGTLYFIMAEEMAFSEWKTKEEIAYGVATNPDFRNQYRIKKGKLIDSVKRYLLIFGKTKYLQTRVRLGTRENEYCLKTENKEKVCLAFQNEKRKEKKNEKKKSKLGFRIVEPKVDPLFDPPSRRPFAPIPRDKFLETRIADLKRAIIRTAEIDKDWEDLAQWAIEIPVREAELFQLRGKVDGNTSGRIGEEGFQIDPDPER